ncbi:MAG: hypothetical protein ACRDS0_29245 [Pseudonocardiaceae bacterium]
MSKQDPTPTPRSDVWDPFGTLHNALWIGGGSGAAKSTIAGILAARYDLTAYHYDYHDARAHNDRRIARRIRGALISNLARPFEFEPRGRPHRRTPRRTHSLTTIIEPPPEL